LSQVVLSSYKLASEQKFVACKQDLSWTHGITISLVLDFFAAFIMMAYT